VAVAAGTSGAAVRDLQPGDEVCSTRVLARHCRDGRVRLIELAGSEPCFDELLDCVTRTGGQWRCQRLVVGDGAGGRLPGMCVETRVTDRPLSPVCVVDDAFVAVSLRRYTNAVLRSG
jgi:hypothetical protein